MKIAAFAIAAFAAVVSTAQAPVAPTAADLERTVTRFFETADQYARTFRNLTVDETRVLEEFDASGRTSKRRVIVADLVVYRPAQTGDETGAEYRDAKSVDGKPVAKRDKRALVLITRAANSASLAAELRLINRESQRHDLRFSAGPFTLGQIPRSTMREQWNTLPISQQAFRFNWVGPAKVNGHDVVELEYREAVPQERHTAIPGDLYNGMGITGFFERGRLCLDAATQQVRRSRWELAITRRCRPQFNWITSRFSGACPRGGCWAPLYLDGLASG